MATIYFQHGTGESYEVTVYLRHAALLPHVIEHEIPASINRTEDGKLKVYKHSLAGPKKRIWHMVAYMTDTDPEEGYCWSDLETFYWQTIEGPMKQFTFSDNAGETHTVRMIQFGPPDIEAPGVTKIRMILEEDYA